jgi:serine-type D-Ala-D-Ala carboxypeptidase/endopeptidase (penicillin-binding protein 4)
MLFRGPKRAALRPSAQLLLAIGCAASLAACHAALPTSAPRASVGKPAQPAPPALPALVRDIDALLAAPALAHGYWGVLVKSLKTDETLYSVNARRLMMPASNMKIVTLAATAERLGWNYTYETSVFAAARIDGGVLQGDLIVVGSGDPSIGETPDVLGAWAEQLKARGLRVIAGRIIGDDNAFDDDGLGFGWSWDDLPDDYAAGVSALQYNENAVRVTVGPGVAAGDWAGVAVSPPSGGLVVESSLTTSAADRPATISAHRLPGTPRLRLSGAVPLGAPPVSRDVSVDNPTQFFVNALRTTLIAHGIDVRGPAVDIDDIRDAPPPPYGAPFISHRSPPLSTLALRLMKASQNLYAETFLKTLGAGASGRSTADGRSSALAVLQAWGVGADGLILRDGSGLSRYDYVTPEALVTILMHVDRQASLKGPFEESLPIAGRDGSLSNRMKGTAAEGNARAKTGSMSNVRGLSGFVTTADGEPLAFSILANNFETPADTINRTADAIVVRLAEFKR